MPVETMSPFAITASDVSGQKRARITGMPEDATVGELVEALLKDMNLPRNDSGGRPLTYRARLDREGRHLQEQESVKETLSPQDHITLQPNIDAGGWVKR